MAISRKWSAVKCKQVRRREDGSSKQGCGDDKHIIVGSTGKGKDQWNHRSLIRFKPNWTDVERLVSAYIYVMVEDDSTHFTLGKNPKVRAALLSESFAEGYGAENVWTSAEYEWPDFRSGQSPYTPLPINPNTGLPQDETWVAIDVTSIIKPVVPTGVKMLDGSRGGGKTNYGFLLKTVDVYDNNDRAIFYSMHASSSSKRPYLQITFDRKNQAPLAPTLKAPPTSGQVTLADNFEGVHSDPDNDPMAARLIRITNKNTGEQWWLPEPLRTAGSDESQTGRFVVPLSHAATWLKLGTPYEWVAKTQDPDGLWGPYSSPRNLTITSSAPSVVASTIAPQDSMDNVKIGGTYSDPEGDELALYHIQMQPAGLPDWSDPGQYVWNTGESSPTAEEVTSGVIARQYSGKSLDAGDYTFRIKVQDSTGVWSPWDEGTFTLLLDYDPNPGDATLTTQVARNAPVRIALWKMGTDRGRGALIGYIEDPMDLGGSGYLNGAGEVYFTLPALHPFCPEIEPWHTHYSVQQYYGDRYRPMFEGVITDFDGVADEMVAYGTDYLGLLQFAMDERYNPDKPNASYTNGGSKYTNISIDTVIKDQLKYHRDLANSNVAFIQTGSISAMAEKVTIYSTYAEALPFITGLIDSHKQGTGREARFYCRQNPSTNKWEWRLVDDWGVDRPNIRLEYGGLVNDFRVVGFGDFATRVLGVGQKRGEVKVYRATEKSGLSENEWGRSAKGRFWQDITDLNDLRRRTKEAAVQLAKVGKRIALAIQADSLSPFDGWDIGDNIVIDIERGIIDTGRYGSGGTLPHGGYWTIYGVEWRYYPDGHSDLTLTILPKKTEEAPDPDLIPSINPGTGLDWQVGYGVPSQYGELPGATPEAFSIASPVTPSTYTYTAPSDYDTIGHFWQDLNTGCVYELDEDFDSPTFNQYTQVYCPDAGGGGYVPDTTPPPAPEVLSLTSDITQYEDGSVAPRITAEVGYSADPSIDDLARYGVQFTRVGLVDDLDSPDWTYAVDRYIASEDANGLVPTFVALVPALTVTRYWVRVLAEDKSGNKSGYSPVVEITTTRDSDGPPRPVIRSLLPGFESFGLAVEPSTATDWSYNEVHWRAVGDTDWRDPVRAKATVVGVTGLVNGTEYEVEVRSVDTSGNVVHDTGAVDGEGNAIYESVLADVEPTKGWVAAGTVTPSNIPGSKVFFSEADIENLLAGNISADWISGGTITVGGQPGMTNGLEVYDDQGRLVGRWNADGIRVLDPDNPQYELAIDEAQLTIWDRSDPANPVQRVRVTPLGIDAASVTFGSARGGHNLVSNSSFELGKFGTTAITTHTWTAAADWNTTRVGSDTNITTGATELSMTSVT